MCIHSKPSGGQTLEQALPCSLGHQSFRVLGGLERVASKSPSPHGSFPRIFEKNLESKVALGLSSPGSSGIIITQSGSLLHNPNATLGCGLTSIVSVEEAREPNSEAGPCMMME